jgi:two-component sensor histidine kinase
LTQLKPNWSAAASSHKRRSRGLADPEQGREIGAVTILPAQDRDERTLLRELTQRIHNEFISSINVVSAAAVRTENPEVKVALSDVVELLEQHADINRVLSVPDRDGRVDAAEYTRRLAFGHQSIHFGARRDMSGTSSRHFAAGIGATLASRFGRP